METGFTNTEWLCWWERAAMARYFLIGNVFAAEASDGTVVVTIVVYYSTTAATQCHAAILYASLNCDRLS